MVQKSHDGIKALDADDESLVKYNQALLAGVDPNAAPADDPRRVVVQKMAFVVEGRDDIEFDLTGDLSKLQDQVTVVKEGVEFRIRITFKVQHEIDSGILYHHTVSRNNMLLDKQTYMVGSYGPKAESYEYFTPVLEATKGLMTCGHYIFESKFIDDDKNVLFQWESSMDIKKDWA